MDDDDPEEVYEERRERHARERLRELLQARDGFEPPDYGEESDEEE